MLTLSSKQSSRTKLLRVRRGGKKALCSDVRGAIHRAVSPPWLNRKKTVCKVTFDESTLVTFPETP